MAQANSKEGRPSPCADPKGSTCEVGEDPYIRVLDPAKHHTRHPAGLCLIARFLGMGVVLETSKVKVV
jgi:hypothetical protein